MAGRPPHKSELEKASGEVLVLCRVDSDHAADVKDALIKVSRIIPNYGGKLLGVGNKVKVLDHSRINYKYKRSQCMVALLFPSQETANRWSYSDPIFRDKDFPAANAALEMVSVPLLYLPPSNCHSMQLTTFIVSPDNRERLQNEFMKPAEDIYDKYNVTNGIASTNDVRDMQHGWIDRHEYMVIHMFRNENQLFSVYNDPEYAQLKELLNKLSTSCTVAFNLE